MSEEKKTENLSQNKKDVIKTIGDLRTTMKQTENRGLLDVLETIKRKRPKKVTIEYEDIGESLTFIVHPITVGIEMRLSNFKSDIEKDKFMITEVVTTEDGRPISVTEAEMMPLGMMKTLVKTAENLAFLQLVREEDLSESLPEVK